MDIMVGWFDEDEGPAAVAIIDHSAPAPTHGVQVRFDDETIIAFELLDGAITLDTRITSRPIREQLSDSGIVAYTLPEWHDMTPSKPLRFLRDGQKFSLEGRIIAGTLGTNRHYTLTARP